MANERETAAAASRSHWKVLLAVGIGLLVCAFILGGWIFSRGNSPFAVDLWWNTLLAGLPSDTLVLFARFMNAAGGGIFGTLVVPIAGTIALIVVRRPWAAAYFLSAEALSAGGVQLLKHLFGRARPEDIIVVTDYGSFPSGHVANAATLAAIVTVLFPRVWVAIMGAAWVVLMAFSRTYLHAHWLSDTFGGALLGVGAALTLAALFSVPMAVDSRIRAARSLPKV